MSSVVLPEGWCLATFGDLLLSASNGIGGSQNKDGDGIPVSRIETIAQEVINFEKIGYIANFDVQKIEKYKLEKGDILFSHINSPIHLGKTAIFNSDKTLFHGVNLLRLIVDKQLVTPELFNLYCKLARAQSEFSLNAQHAVNQSSLNQKKLFTFSFPLPSLAEQKVIAAKLDQLLAQVDILKTRLTTIPRLLKRFRQSVLAAAVSGKLTEEWRVEQSNLTSLDVMKADLKTNRKMAWLNEQEKSCTRTQNVFDREKVSKRYSDASVDYSDEFSLTQIHTIPNSWLAVNVDSVAIVVTGKTPSTTVENNWNGNIPFISPTQIKPEGKIISPERFVSTEGMKVVSLLPKGAVLIVCIGTIGKVGLLDVEAAFNQQINALIPTKSIQSKFLFYWAKTLNAWLNKTSSAVVNSAIINKSKLCSAPCPLPPLEEQTEIVRRVEQLFAFADQIEQQVKNAQSRVNNLTQSILAKAFRGELTTDWRAANPDLITGQNSAQALLEKIKAERGQKGKK